MNSISDTGSVTTSPSDETVPYEKAVKAVDDMRSTMRSLHAEEAPAPISTLIIEETFSLLHHGALYSGMGEEALTAAFASALAAAGVMWRRQWVWHTEIGVESFLWNQYSKSSETVLGADFSLIFADLNKDGDATEYRLIVAQAKRHTASDPQRLHVQRKGFSTAGDRKAPPGWQADADARLRKALVYEELDEQEIEPGTPNWQLSRLLSLHQRMKAVDIPASFVYVIWPASPDNDGNINPVLYEQLHVVSDEIQKNFAENGKLLQSFEIDENKHFREYLLNYRNIDAMSETQLLDVLETIKAKSAATILINASGKPLSPNLKSRLGTSGIPPYVPATPQAARKYPQPR